MDIKRRAQVSQAANDRYLEGLAGVATSAALGELAGPLCRSVRGHPTSSVAKLFPHFSVTSVPSVVENASAYVASRPLRFFLKRAEEPLYAKTPPGGGMDSQRFTPPSSTNTLRAQLQNPSHTRQY